MLSERVREHIRGLSDPELVEYAMTGRRLYEENAVRFAREELQRRGLNDQQLDAIQPPIVEKLARYDERQPKLDELKTSAAILCSKCGCEVPNRYVEYAQCIGLFVLWHSTTYRGWFCRRCNHVTFWKASLITGILGWWGLISFFVTIIYLLRNIIVLLRSFSLEPAPRHARPPQLDDDSILRIVAQRQFIDRRMKEGKYVSEVAREAALLAGVTPGQVLCFIYNFIVRDGQVGADPPIHGFPVLPVKGKEAL